MSDEDAIVPDAVVVAACEVADDAALFATVTVSIPSRDDMKSFHASSIVSEWNKTYNEAEQVVKGVNKQVDAWKCIERGVDGLHRNAMQLIQHSVELRTLMDTRRLESRRNQEVIAP